MPTVCNAANQGECACPAGEGITSYVWWMDEGQHRDSVVQRCFQIYVPPAAAASASAPVPGVVSNDCYAGNSDPARAKAGEFESAEQYRYAVLFLSNPLQRWLFPNDGVINADSKTPCDDSDSVDLEYSRLALETFAGLGAVDSSKIFSKGFSQNSMWSAVLGVCFPQHIARFAQAGSGLALRGAAVTPPGSQSECTQSARAELGRGCLSERPCDGTNNEPLCTWWPIYPEEAAAGGVVAEAGARRAPLQACGFVYEDDYLFETQLPMYDALVAEGHQARYLRFPGGKHQMPANGNDWVVGCLGIQAKCSAECEADVVACTDADQNSGGSAAFAACLHTNRPASCEAACAPTLAMLSASETPSSVKASAGTFDAWPDQQRRERNAVRIRGRVVPAGDDERPLLVPAGDDERGLF